MATHDYNIANATGADVRSDLNNVFAAILSNNSSASEPTTTAAYMLWVDTTNNVIKLRNSADDGWITLPLSISADNTVDINGGTVNGITSLSFSSGSTVTSILDEDALSSNSDSALATQQSIKAYVDAQVTAQDLDFQADSGGALNIDLDSESLTFTGGTGIDTSGSGNEVTFAIDSTVATKTYVQQQITAEDLDFQADSGGVLNIDLDSETFTLSGGTGIDTTGAENTVTFAIDSTVATLSDTQTLTNKTIDADNNTVSNLEVDNLKSGVLDTDLSSVSGSDDTLASAKAIKTYVDTQITAEDLDVSDGSTNIAIDLDSEVLGILGGTGVTSSASGNNVTLAIGQSVGTSDDVTFNSVAASLTGNVTGTVSDISNHSTSDLSEGTNLYYTTARFDTRLATKDTGDIAEGSNLYFTNERVDDRVNALLQAGSNITLTYDDAANTLTIAGVEDNLSNNDTDDLSEGSTNLYFTNARARSAISVSGDLAYNSSTGVLSFTERTDAEVRGLISVSGDLAYNSSTGVVSFTQRTDAQVRGLVSASGDLSYNSSTGVFSFTQRTDAQVQALITGGTGVTVSSGEVAIGQAVATTSDVTFNDVTVSGNLTVSGTTTNVNTETINLADNQIVLNSNYTGSSPTENGGIEIERGTQTNKTLIWNETDDKWTVGSETFVAATFEGALTGNVTGTVSSISNHDTDALSEGSSNLYYTDTRVNSAFDTRLATKNTDNLSEGSTNLYYTDARVNSAFDTRLATKDTGDLSEGTNLYYTDARFDTRLGTKTTDNLTEGSSNLYHTTERVQDVVGGQLVTNGSHTGISFTYDDGNDGALDATVSLSSFSTSNLSEGSNLYFTNERVDDRVASLLTAGSNITLTYDDSAGTLTIASTDTEDDLSNNDTDDLSEGSTNLYFTDERVDDRVNNLLTAGTGISLSYDDAANTLTITGSAQYGDSDVESYLDGGTSTPTFASAIVSGDLTIDTNTLKVDSSNNRVGILDATPAVSLDIGSATDAIHVPSGTTAQRPTGANGMFRYNSTDNQFEGYADGAWGAIAGSGSSGASAMETDTFNGDDSTTTFTLSSSVNSEDNLIVFIDGVYQNKADYVASGTSIQLDTAPLAGRKIVVHHIKDAVSGSNCILNTFTGNGSTTTYTLTQNPVSELNTQIFLDGVYQRKDSYSVSSTTLTFDAAPANGTAIEVMMFTQTDINTLPASFVSGLTEVTATGSDHLMVYDATDGALKKALASDLIETVGSTPSFTSATISGDLTVDTSTLKVDSTNNRVGVGTVSPDFLMDIEGSNTQFKVGTASQDGGFLTSTDNNQLIASGGFYYNGTNFIATATSASGVSFDNGATYFYNNTGLTDDASFTLNETMRISNSGTVAIGTTPSVHMFTVSTATSGILAANFVNTNTGGYGVNISAGSGTNYVLRAENYAGGTLWQINADGNMCHGFTDDVDGANYSVYSNNSNGIAIGSGSGSNQYRRIYHAASDGILRFKSSSNTPYLSNAGAWTNASDRAYKENIEDIEYGLDTVEALQPRKFDMIDDGSHEIGFIAQEVEELIPEVVIGDEGHKGIGYGQLTAVLTKAIQELKTELDAAKARIETLENA